MGGTISIKDKGTADSGIKDLGALQATITTLGTDIDAELDEIGKLLAVTVDGETAGAEGTSGVGAALKAEADAVSTSVGALTGEWRAWVDGLTVTDEKNATDVKNVGGDAPAPTPKTETPKPADPEKPKSPLTPDPSVPQAFSMK